MTGDAVVGWDRLAQQAPGRHASAFSAPLEGLLRNYRPLAAMLDQALVSGTSFLATVLVGRFAGEQQLGLYALGFTLLVLACGVQESLVLIPYTVFAMRTADDRRARFAGSSLLQSLAGSLAIVLCLAIGGVMVAAVWGAPRAAIAAVLLITAPLALLRDFGRRFAFAQMRLGWALAIDGAVALSQLALLGWLSLSGRLSAVAGLAALGISCGAAALGWLWRCRRQFAVCRAEIRGDWLQNWSFGRWLLAGHVTGITQAYALHWLLAAALSAAATGEFAAVATIVSLANPLIIGAGNFLMPATARAFAQSGADEVWNIAVRATLWLAAALVPCCVAAALAGDWLLKLLYGARFGGQTLTVTLMAVAATAAALGIGAEHALRSMDRPRAVFLANLTALCVTLASAAWLIPACHVVGAAGALLAGNFTGCLARWWAVWRLFSRLEDGLPSPSSNTTDGLGRSSSERLNGELLGETPHE